MEFRVKRDIHQNEWKKFQFNLAGRVALVSGASSGLGARFAWLLGQSGVNVVLAARRVDRLEGVVDERKAAGGDAIAVEMDATDEASTCAVYDQAEAIYGTADTIIANAGTSASGLATSLPVDEFDFVSALNL